MAHITMMIKLDDMDGETRAAGEKIGFDRMNADLFPAGVAGALSLFTDFVIGHACTYERSKRKLGNEAPCSSKVEKEA